MRLFAACAPGLEPLLAEEVLALGATSAIVPGGIEFEGDLAQIYRANLELGLALFVLARVATFRATKFPELVRKIEAVDFSPWIGRNQNMGMRVRARASRLYHTGAIEERVRNGLGASLGRPPLPLAENESGPLLHVRMDADECTLSVDTSGESLHRRGYRQATAKAPFREDLARALIRLSGWNRKSIFADPLTGSGTLPIEAALLARDLPPGANRRFAFMNSPNFNSTLFETIRKQSLARSVPHLPFSILGSDRDPGAIRAATENATRAGVENDLRLDCAPLSTAPFQSHTKEPDGALILNPPWGQRIGETNDLRALYQTIGKLIRALPPRWHAAVATSDPKLAQSLGAGLTSALLTDVGGTKVRMYVRRA